MTLRCKVDNAVNVILLHETEHSVKVTNISFYKYIVCAAFNILKVCQIACIRQFIQIYDAIFRVFIHEKSYYMAAYKSGTARD